MRNNSSRTTAFDSVRSPRFRVTCGEILADGSVLDLVAQDDELRLCQWDGRKAVVVPFVDQGGLVYVPPKLMPSLLHSVRFPAGPVDHASLPDLFRDTTAALQSQGLTQNDAQWLFLAAIVSWVPELFPSFLTFLVCGSEVSEAATVFSLFACICRRGLTVAELSRRLPFAIRPTLLALSTELSARQQAFWRASNFSNVWVPCGAGGAVENFSCLKILFTDSADALSGWGSNVLRLSLLPHPQLLRPNEQDLAKIAAEFQPKFLMFRLRRLQQLATQSPSKAGPPNKFSNCEFARKLLACLQEPEITAALTPLLEAQVQEIREHQLRDPSRAILESLWSPSHKSKEMPIAELTKRVNALVQSRGEVLQFDSREIGWRLTSLGLPRDRSGQGMRLRFSRDIQRQLHQVALHFQMDLSKFVDCQDCKSR